MVRSNGFYVQQANITPNSIHLGASTNDEYTQFK